MTKQYGITFIKREYYEVEANNADEATNKAFELLETDPFGFMDPVDEVEVEEI